MFLFYFFENKLFGDFQEAANNQEKLQDNQWVKFQFCVVEHFGKKTMAESFPGSCRPCADAVLAPKHVGDLTGYLYFPCLKR